MANIPQLTPDGQFPQEALNQTKQEFPEPTHSAGGMMFTWNIASAADSITPWGRSPMLRDRQLRDFWPTEPFLAGAVANVGFRNATFDWEIQSPSSRVSQVVTDMLNSALAGDTFGWVNFMLKFSEDLYTQDNGAFVELIRDPGADANSRFKDEAAPVIGIAHLDANQCQRTGNPEFPVIYVDREGRSHKMRWWEVIPFSDYPSSIERMNGMGYCAVTRVLRLGQIMRSTFLFKDEKISGRHFKSINFVSGVTTQEIKDMLKRGQEEANNSGMLRYIQPAIIASLDPEKPVSTASIDLASLPDGFDFDAEMRWYISGLALGFGVDYQEFAPLPGGNIGSSAQSTILHRKQSGKGPGVLMRVISESFKNYGVLPRGSSMRYNDKDEQEELEKQEVRTKAVEEAAVAVNSGVLSPEAAAKSLVRRGIYTEEEVAGLEKFWEQVVDSKFAKPPKQPVGDRGGNTIAEDAGRTNAGSPRPTESDRLLKKEREENEFRMWDVVKLAMDIARGQKPQVTVVKENAKPANVKVDVHNHPGKPPVVNVTNEMKAQKPPVVNVNIPQQKPPIVNVEAPKVEVKNTVNVPKQDPPIVNVAAPNVQVNLPERKATEIVYDGEGKPIGLKPK